MRLLRELPDERTATLLADALYHRGIDNNVSPSQTGTFRVWVVDEAELDRAAQLATKWLEQGLESELLETAQRGRLAKDEQARAALTRQKQIERAREEIARVLKPRPTPLTWGLIALCVAIFVLSGMPGFEQPSDELESVLRALAIVDPSLPLKSTTTNVFGFSITYLALPWHEPWRLLTPVLVHHDIFHLIFNMLVLVQLGRVLEMRHGSRRLFAITLVSGVISNIAQYEIVGNPLFAGFSGVVYALLGFLWIRGRLDPAAGYRLTPSAVSFMLVWLAFGFLGSFGGVQLANFCHLFGLLVGMSWGFISARLATR